MFRKHGRVVSNAAIDIARYGAIHCLSLIARFILDRGTDG